MIALHVNLSSGDVKREEYRYSGIVELGVELNLKERTYRNSRIFVFGKGPFTDTGLPGTHRLTFVFRSPLTGGLQVSSMGGAAWYFKRTGIDALVLEGRAKEPVVISLEGNGKNCEPSFISFEEGEIFEFAKEGVRALSEKIASLVRYSARSVVVGLASFTTPFGALYSADMQGGKVVKGSEDFAGRGGGGSALFEHNVVGIVFGGARKPSGVDERARKVIEKTSQKPYMEAILEATVKYRFDPKLKSGGTFGSNYPHLQIYTPMFNFSMIYMSREERERLWRSLMGKKWWAKFNEEVMKIKAFKTCGEPCPVACKKVWSGIKVDYEPFESCGPMCWIFELEHAARVVRTADSLGYDAIELGSTLAWILECIQREMLPGEDVGFNGEWESGRIADFGVMFANQLALANDRIYRILREGKRRGAELLNRLYSTSVKDLAVYVPYGKEGYMTPTMYWAVGNYMPLPLPGRYWTFYKFAVFLEPEELAEKSLGRAIAEMWMDNLGICRFHRGWFEKAMRGLLKLKGMEMELREKGMEILKKIIDYNRKAGAMPQLLETERTKDMIAIGAREFGNREWAEKFRKDREEALMEYWERFQSRFHELLGD